MAKYGVNSDIKIIRAKPAFIVAVIHFKLPKKTKNDLTSLLFIENNPFMFHWSSINDCNCISDYMCWFRIFEIGVRGTGESYWYNPLCVFRWVSSIKIESALFKKNHKGIWYNIQINNRKHMSSEAEWSWIKVN